jgi:uncharacterized protein YbaA (DUF1428 family)
MPVYVDGFVIPVPKKNLPAYLKLARQASKVWKEYGALCYKECVGEDLNVPFGMGFPKGIGIKKGETVVFSWIIFKSRAHRDKVNAKVMSDPRIAEVCDPKDSPFDAKRMLYGGFTIAVSD